MVPNPCFHRACRGSLVRLSVSAKLINKEKDPSDWCVGPYPKAGGESVRLCKIQLIMFPLPPPDFALLALEPTRLCLASSERADNDLQAIMSQSQRPTESGEEKAVTPVAAPAAARWRRTQVGIRSLFVLTAAAVLGLTGYIANRWGSSHIEKIYAAAIAGAVVAVLADSLAIVLLSVKPRAVPAVAVVDLIAIVLGAISIPTIIDSDFQNKYDAVAWKLVAVVIAERVLSMSMVAAGWFISNRELDEDLKPQIFDQRLSVMSMKNIQLEASTAPTSTAASSIMMASPGVASR
ncbi:hypothetical protein B0H66DRAFT_559648 [Apodospora peruviana]|uniref:Uncharacterized protein n=1 Tax=Apodospora peruviana TaxID=516989 RepID=A0AAE0M1V8_9PEZI|nr:hypothetical protein B0H66DRAFT_559648 [Apodospora peruviana]